MMVIPREMIGMKLNQTFQGFELKQKSLLMGGV